MDFYYPNFNNDMWRILGIVFYGERERFIVPGKKCFDREKIVDFLSCAGIGIYDSAEAVNRLKGNASDAFLEIAVPTDIRKLLSRIPECGAVVTTGTLATETVADSLGIEAPPVGGKVPFSVCGGELSLYRMPSSSRAYPLVLEKKVEAYRKMFSELEMVH